MAQVYLDVLTKEIAIQTRTSLKKTFERAARREVFLPAVREMEEEFDNHPVTQEIEGGPDGESLTNTLGGRDNLFSFIGFKQGSNPTDKIRPSLSTRSAYGPQMKLIDVDVNSYTFTYLVTAPDIETAYARTPLPWANGISWARGIEEGISGLARYINIDHPLASKKKIKFDKSRSGTGLQLRQEIRSDEFEPTSYLSEIFGNFLKRLRNTRI